MNKMKRGGKRWNREIRRVGLHVGYGWAWTFEGGTCHWVEPDRGKLLQGGKPSDESRPIKVAIVPIYDWQRARAALSSAKRRGK